MFETINPYALMSLIPGIACFVLAFYVFSLNRKNNINRIFFILLMTLVVWLLSEFAYRQITVASDAYLWLKIRAFIWPFTIAMMMHFVLLYTKHEKLVEQKLVLFMIYAPAIVFAILEATTQLITGPPIMMSWGFTYEIPDNLFNILSLIWTSFAGIMSLALSFMYHRSAKEKNIRLQAGFFVLGLIIPIIVGLSTEVFLPFFLHTRIVEMFSLSCLSFCIMVTYAIWKHNLFPLTPEEATHEILESIADCVILMNTDGTVAYSNKATQNILGYTEDELISSGQEILGKNSGLKFSELAPALESGKMVDFQVNMKKKDGSLITVSLTGSPIIGKNKQVQGFVIIGRDITSRKKYEEELKKKTEDLEKFNQLSVGREQKMVELKKRISELEAKLGEKK